MGSNPTLGAQVFSPSKINNPREIEENLKCSNSQIQARIGSQRQIEEIEKYGSSSQNSQIQENFSTNQTNLIKLKSIYFSSKNSYKVYTLKKFSKSYAVSVFNNLYKIFEKNDSDTIEDIKKCLAYEKVNKRMGGIAIRVWLNYLEEFDILDFDVVEYVRKRIKIHQKTYIDTYIPTDSEVEKSIDEARKYDKIHYLLYRFFIETTARTTEVKHFFENFNEKNIEIHNNRIVSYNNFYIRGQKSSYYLFFTVELYNELKEFISKYSSTYFNRFIDHIQDNKNIVCLKYLRKYSFNLMVREGVSIEIANFISGRSTSKNIGMTHYLNKKEIAIIEYEKVLEKIKF